ncbi:hypothetical protein [Nocardia thraciensis]
MTAAADPRNTATVAALLAITAPHRDDEAETVSAEQRWESDGGAATRVNPTARA